MHAMLSNDYKRKLCCMAAGAPAAFQSENTRVRPPIIDVFHVMYFMSDPQALHVTRNVIPGKLGVDLHLHRVHIPLVMLLIYPINSS